MWSHLQRSHFLWKVGLNYAVSQPVYETMSLACHKLIKPHVLIVQSLRLGRLGSSWRLWRLTQRHAVSWLNLAHIFTICLTRQKRFDLWSSMALLIQLTSFFCLLNWNLSRCWSYELFCLSLECEWITVLHSCLLSITLTVCVCLCSLLSEHYEVSFVWGEREEAVSFPERLEDNHYQGNLIILCSFCAFKTFTGSYLQNSWAKVSLTVEYGKHIKYWDEDI